MTEEHFFHRPELVRLLDGVLGKTLGEVDRSRVFDRAGDAPKVTGIAGAVVEQSVLGFPADNAQRPDLDVDGVKTELKTTGLRETARSAAGYAAKEPMSITAVSLGKIVDERFETSSFWHKLEHMLIVYYLYTSKTAVPARGYADFPIVGYEFLSFSPADVACLKNDWELVRDFVRRAQRSPDPGREYARLSSALRKDLLYIDTAPKYPHPPRFRLKASVVTCAAQAHFGQRLEQLPGRFSSYRDIDDRCRALAAQYGGRTVGELLRLLGVRPDGEEDPRRTASKAVSEQLVVAMFGGRSKKLSRVELFQKIGLRGKTVVLTAGGARTEDMKLFAVDFGEWLDQDAVFETSALHDYFAHHQLLCAVFREPSPKAPLTDNVFVGFKRLSFDAAFLHNEVYPLWRAVRATVLEGRLAERPVLGPDGLPRINKNGAVQTSVNFPKSRDGVLFLRGSGADSGDKPVELSGVRMYRQSVWIRGSYIARLLDVTPSP